MKWFGKIISAAMLATVAMPLRAVVLRYTISGTDTLADGQAEYALFQIDTARVPDGYEDGVGLYYAAVPGFYRYGDATTTDPQDISFYLDAADGGLFVGGGDLLGFDGPELFTGSVQDPTLLTGEFTLTDYFSGSPIHLTVAVVPEPAAWMMMIAGFAMAGMALRSRKAAVRFA